MIDGRRNRIVARVLVPLIPIIISMSMVFVVMTITPDSVANARQSDGVDTAMLGSGELIDAYALADGRSLVVSLHNAEGIYYIVATPIQAGVDGVYSEARGVTIKLPPGSGRPDKIITEVCGGRLHIFYGWDVKGRHPIGHYVWDLPFVGVHKSFFPVVCRGE